MYKLKKQKTSQLPIVVNHLPVSECRRYYRLTGWLEIHSFQDQGMKCVFLTPLTSFYPFINWRFLSDFCKWVYWFHQAGEVWGYTSITMKIDKRKNKKNLTKTNTGVWQSQRKQFFVILLTFNVIVQPCSQRAKTTSCRLHVSHYSKCRHRA